MQNEPIQIENSRIKMAVMFIGCLLFVSAGIWFVLEPQKVVIPLFREPFMIRIVGVVSIVLFGSIGVFILKKLGDKRPAIIISDEGITDYVNVVSLGFIPWGDVAAITENIIAGKKLISIELKNPEHYISLQKNSIKRKLLETNYKQYGMLVSLSASSLQCHHHQLKTLLNNAFSRYKADK